MIRRTIAKCCFVAVLPGMLVLSGCFLPSSGPSSVAVEGGAEISASQPYALVPLTNVVAEILQKTEPKILAGFLTDRTQPSAIRFGIGDVLAITIFESAAGGLFIPAEAGIRPGNFVTLPEQMIDNAGNISVPYAGSVQAAGRTSVEVQNAILKQIPKRAIEPQVIVTISQQKTALVSVFGDVNSPVRFPAAYAGARDRITDALTRAGGIKSPGYETWVVFERNGKRATVPFENLISIPSNNIFVQPGDQLYVYREPQKFIAFGATGQQGTVTFDAWRINLAEAVGKARGLVDTQADPASVYLYRREPRAVAQALGVDLLRFPTEQVIPVIFTANFADAGGYFVATQVLMRNQDVLFVANAPSVEVTKFLALLNLASATFANTAIGASTLK